MPLKRSSRYAVRRPWDWIGFDGTRRLRGQRTRFGVSPGQMKVGASGGDDA
jgi:hypothetical protein